MTAAQPDLRQQIAAIRAEFERTTHPDWRDVHPTGVLLAALDQHAAENAQLRAEIRDWLGLRDARMSLQAFRHAIGSTATQITDLIHGIGRATGPLARAQREAAHYQRRWESTVVEARRQAARAEAAEQALAEVTAWAHAAIYHSGGPACPAPGTCTAAAVSAPTT